MIGILINVGYNNLVSAERVVAIVNPNSVPAKRLRDEARQAGLLIDASAGHRVRSMIVSSSKHVIVSAIEVRTLANRYNDACVSFHGRVGQPLVDELGEPGQGPDLGWDEEAPPPAKKSAAKAAPGRAKKNPEPGPDDDGFHDHDEDDDEDDGDPFDEYPGDGDEDD
jgi:regulator of extracellular matrix RemA (YlzA/DUF370 family)